MAPLENDLQRLRIENILYALDEGLRTTPVAAMMNGDQFAIERYGLSIIPSVGLLRSEVSIKPPSQMTLAAGANEFIDQEALPAVPIELEMIRGVPT
jgi:CHAT domain-containing protein